MARYAKHGPSTSTDSLGAGYKAVLRYNSRTKMHIAYTPGLVYAQADTPDRARRTLEGALALFVTAAQKSRSLAAVLDVEGVAGLDLSSGDRDAGSAELWIS